MAALLNSPDGDPITAIFAVYHGAMDEGEFPNVNAYFARLKARPAFVKAMERMSGGSLAKRLAFEGPQPVKRVVAWAGQFYGHMSEGKRPSFFKDVQFLMIGPLWLLSFVYRRLGIRF